MTIHFPNEKPCNEPRKPLHQPVYNMWKVAGLGLCLLSTALVAWAFYQIGQSIFPG